MMALAARNMGYRIAVLDPTEDSPCGQVADIEITAEYSDIEAIQKLSAVSDVITYEFENIDYEALKWLESHANLPQGSRLLAITQDRVTEKEAIQSCGILVAPYRVIQSEKELEESLAVLKTPCVLKTSRGGYDGKGQCIIKHEGDIEKALPLLSIGTCVLEAWVPFEKEISVIVTRNQAGETKTFPVAENIHRENILHQTIVPARITREVEEAASQLAVQLADRLNMIGTLAVEMFLTSDGEIFVNELAPRPHNSGHYTLDACETSQFEQHIRAVCGWPLGSTELLKPVVMANILGEHVEDILKNIPNYTGCKLHLYGKKEAKVKRKMGHLNILAADTDYALKIADSLSIWAQTKETIGGTL